MWLSAVPTSSGWFSISGSGSALVVDEEPGCARATLLCDDEGRARCCYGVGERELAAGGGLEHIDP
jgi:hypothetical protein